MSKPITAIVCRVGHPPSLETVGSDLASLQALVGGYIECIRLTESIDMWINDYGRHQCPVNRLVQHRPIFGDFVITAHDGGGETIGLSGPDAMAWLDKASEWPVAIPRSDR